jgi:hypothetical protein
MSILGWIGAQRVMLTRLFPDREAAERAYQALRSRGYTAADVSVLMAAETRERLLGAAAPASPPAPASSPAPDGDARHSKALEGAGVGAGAGVVAGGVLGALVAAATVVIPGVGLVLAGPLAAAMAGAGVGGAAGGVIGALVGAGIPEDRAVRYEPGLRAGGIVMGVSPRSDEDATYFERQ